MRGAGSKPDLETSAKTTAALLHSVHQLMEVFGPMQLDGCLVEADGAQAIMQELQTMEMMITALGKETLFWHELYLRAQGELDGQLRRKAVLQ